MDKKYVFFDAETDGLYGPFISVGIVATDSGFNEIERAYYGIDKKSLVINDEWVKENVLPKLGEYEACENEDALLEKVWSFWMKYGNDAYAVTDVCYPVEAHLFRKCVSLNEEERKWDGPFPLLDLSSILYAKGIDPLVARTEISGMNEASAQHNALFDVDMSIEIMRKVMAANEQA